ncbi:hypothetical protein GGS23DRAFT_587480 [Durotheca rogersii]|uniref:uncharacterized protein n=1 Tax=Durotheca rogersii TaxID=419775 RepID=UPI00221FC2DE|nr:uncharacterized protein GGS23DRAFT_587480 [Durotheca rogersii]KAI5857448.1 hypothetical protein GGS23DRAFT_587480 [Durotheca rogersii]
MGPQTRSADEDKKVSQIHSICREIRSIYDAGTPFYTKDAIRKVGEELRRFQKGERPDGGNIILKGVNGVDYEVFVNPLTRDPLGENEHLGAAKWMIRYHSVNCLTTYPYKHADFFDFPSAYLPMRIFPPIMWLRDDHPVYRIPPTPPAEDFSAYQAIERQWRTTQHYERLQEILATVEIPFALTKLVALALGPFTIKSRLLDRPVLQHALVSAIHSTLVQRGILSLSSERYVQDPAYTQRDRDILDSLGLTVLYDPQAFLELDESSVLVCISPNPPVNEIVADICRPGIIIWDRESQILPYSPRVKSMVGNEYYEIEIPTHEGFGNLVMLVRKST